MTENVLCEMVQAVCEGNVERARQILDEWPELRDSQDYLNESFHDACMFRQLEMMALFADCGADVNTTREGEDFRTSPLSEAAGAGASNVVRWLLQHGARVNESFEGEACCYGMIAAAIGGYLGVIEMLVDHGANVNSKRSHSTALSWAIARRDNEMADYLRRNGAIEPDGVDVRI